ncbi:uncharacterized protein LOC131657878 [Vicia villosa]|uniref:uncharacterized protein LOC131657878 n=1 Tax=Vicia villosa TaxID=3911 RepID=UPI00273C146B|nr:uncharacterized protein LOC131657878 [Vicia villosa]
MYLFNRGLFPDSDFHKATRIEKSQSMDALLFKAQAYIAYKEKKAASAQEPRDSGIPRSSRFDEPPPRRGGEKRKEDRSREAKDHKGASRYTPLNASRERKLAECKSIEFKDSGVRFPEPGATRPGIDKSKWCKYHKSYGHLTEDCVHLKDAIETMIKEGHISKYAKKGDAPRRETRRQDKSDDDRSPDPWPVLVTFCISRPVDFLPP